MRSSLENFAPEPNSGCWLWLGSVNRDGYACIGRKHASVHRLMYEARIGPIPEGKQIDHKCRVRSCVNPSHMEPVTALENWRRGASFSVENRAKTSCPSGHPYSGDNLYVNPNGRRECRACVRIRDKRRTHRVR